MGLIDYLKIQSSNGVGNDNRVFIIPYNDIYTVTFDNDDIVTGITLHSDKEWTKLEADINSVIYSSSGDQSVTYFSDQDLIIDFTGKSKETEKTINSIKDEINEGLVIIRLDGNNKGWISGISIPRDSYINMPWNEVSDNFNSGETIEDTEEGNKYSLTFKRSSGVKEYLLHSDIVNDFWDWPSEDYVPPPPPPPGFVIKVKTDNTGTSDNNEFEIQTNTNLTYDYNVYKYNEEGDQVLQTFENVTDNLILSWDSPGSYNVLIKPNLNGTGFPTIFFNNEKDKEKIIEVLDWGDFKWGNMVESFYGCSNLTSINTEDIPDFSLTDSFRNCFNGCESLTEIPTGFFDVAVTATFFRHCFNGCASLTSLPTGLFDNCTEVTNFTYCFYNCTSLTSLPTGLFDNNTKVTDFGHCFRYCASLTSIPSGLFDSCTLVEDFSYCFRYCTSLETIPSGLFDNNTEVTTFYTCFRNCTPLTEIPNGLFDNNTKVTDFGHCFRECTTLTSIPSGLFDNNTMVDRFSYCFYECTSITEIPSGLFDNCTLVEDFSFCFRGLSITEIPNNLFSNCTGVTNFSQCFYGCASLTELPLYLFDNNTMVDSYRECFRNCTSLDLSGTSVSNWSVDNATSFAACFYGCTGITDILGIEQWEPFNLSDYEHSGMRYMLVDVTLPTTRYSDMLIEWAAKADSFVNTGIYLHGGNSKYNTDGETARNTLTTTYGWNITDGGPE